MHLLKDKDGEIVIFQPPNLPLVVGLTAQLLSIVLPYGTGNFIAALVAFGALFTWAWLELFDGANLLRRALGCAVLIWLIVSRIS
jgi:hypothetical protein